MNVTALLAHPDDELMAAGTLAKFVDAGDAVTLIIAFSDHRRHELHQSSETLGVRLMEFQADQFRFAWTQESVLHYEPLVSQTNPDLLISHRLHDNNTSHAPLAQTMRTRARKNRVALWEIDAAIPGGIEPECPANNLLVDIDDQMRRKYDAVDAYESVAMQYPGWRAALKARDTLNGYLLHMDADVHYAEAFRIHKSVWL